MKGRKWQVCRGVNVSPEDRERLLLFWANEQPNPSPGLLRLAANLATAVTRHAADGFSRVSEETLRERLEACRNCPQLKDGVCLACGCPVGVKATWRSEGCPENKWALPVIGGGGGCGCSGGPATPPTRS